VHRLFSSHLTGGEPPDLLLLLVRVTGGPFAITGGGVRPAFVFMLSVPSQRISPGLDYNEHNKNIMARIWRHRRNRAAPKRYEAVGVEP
jgi:hypothetical protein